MASIGVNHSLCLSDYVSQGSIRCFFSATTPRACERSDRRRHRRWRGPVPTSELIDDQVCGSSPPAARWQLPRRHGGVAPNGFDARRFRTTPCAELVWRRIRTTAMHWSSVSGRTMCAKPVPSCLPIRSTRLSMQSYPYSRRPTRSCSTGSLIVRMPARLHSQRETGPVGRRPGEVLAMTRMVGRCATPNHACGRSNRRAPRSLHRR